MATATKSKMDEKQMLIGGSWQGSSDGKTFESLDPATGEAHATVPEGTAKDVDAAVDAARSAFESDEWRGLHSSDSKADRADRKSTRLNSSHLVISYAVFCLKKKIRH